MRTSNCTGSLELRTVHMGEAVGANLYLSSGIPSEAGTRSGHTRQETAREAVGETVQDQEDDPLLRIRWPILPAEKLSVGGGREQLGTNHRAFLTKRTEALAFYNTGTLDMLWGWVRTECGKKPPGPFQVLKGSLPGTHKRLA